MSDKWTNRKKTCINAEPNGVFRCGRCGKAKTSLRSLERHNKKAHYGKR